MPNISATPSAFSRHPKVLIFPDVMAILLVLSFIMLLGTAGHQMLGPFTPERPAQISLSPAMLPMYTLRTVARMMAALAASLIFTFIYATWAAKSRRAEMILIPLLDALQSVPVLGYLSFTVVFFLALFPGSQLGPELAAIFAIFTSQAWNMAFSFYQSLRTVPTDLDEASRSFPETAWQRFWKLEVPFAMPGLIWNTMMSMSGGWFFVVASEAIAVGSTQVALPGVGSYVATAIEQHDLAAVMWAIVAMSIAIVVCDQLLFRPLVAWADKFRCEQTVSQAAPRSWVFELMSRSPVLQWSAAPVRRGFSRVARARFMLPHGVRVTRRWRLPTWIMDLVWYGLIAVGVAAVAAQIGRYIRPVLTWADLRIVLSNGGLTFLRVVVLVAVASIIWVPAGVAIGLRPRLTQRIQPIAQFLAAFPANLLFPLAVYLIVHFSLAPKIWLSPLMILGTQWYILFNVIAGASAIPSDFREAAASFRVRPWHWWSRVMLPGIFPYFVTGAITASGGAWNASIVAEAVSWGPIHLSASGLGAYIAEQTAAGDYPRIALGIAVMSVMVILMNRLLWRPMYAFAERRTRLD